MTTLFDKQEQELQQNPYIVMTAAAAMPSSCWGTYRRVAVVELDLEACEKYNIKEPKMISEHARGIKRIIAVWEKCNVGKTARCAYQRALAEAQALADEWNQRRFRGARK